MEQLTDPKGLIRNSQSVVFKHRSHEDPPGAWARLNRIGINLTTAGKNHLTLDPEDPDAQRFDILKTRLLRQAQTDNLRRVGITSPTPNCGKSLITANLALSMSRQCDMRTLVFDFNLRNPGLCDFFGLRRTGPKYSALRATRRTFNSTALRLSDTLAVSLNATAEPDSVQILSSAHTTKLLSDIEAAFEPDLVLFDLPSLTPSADALVALGLMDAALMVAEAESTTLDEINEGERLIAENTKYLGVILNRCRAIA